jgi:methylmalonyl-CoA mutase, C-terminal domain
VRPPRVVLAKPGLDGHDRGIKVIAMALRDAGAEVVYLGLRRTIPEIVQAAIQDDVDVIGISFLSGAHLPLAEDLLHALEGEGSRIPVVVGGTIPQADVVALRESGVAAVYPVGTGLQEVVDGVLALASRERVQP